MILWNRIKNVWAWSAYHPNGNSPEEVGFTWTGWKKPQKAEFIMPNRVEEIARLKADATIDDLLS